MHRSQGSALISSPTRPVAILNVARTCKLANATLWSEDFRQSCGTLGVVTTYAEKLASMPRSPSRAVWTKSLSAPHCGHFVHGFSAFTCAALERPRPACASIQRRTSSLRSKAAHEAGFPRWHMVGPRTHVYLQPLHQDLVRAGRSKH